MAMVRVVSLVGRRFLMLPYITCLTFACYCYVYECGYHDDVLCVSLRFVLVLFIIAMFLLIVGIESNYI